MWLTLSFLNVGRKEEVAAVSVGTKKENEMNGVNAVPTRLVSSVEDVRRRKGEVNDETAVI